MVEIARGINRRSAGAASTLASLSREAPVLIAGPTASGKSALAMELAARDGRVIVNADALQVYANWRVLTARPTPAEEAAAPHALYGHVARDTPYSVGHWLREVAGVLAGGRPVVITGGSGLYLSALTEGLAEVPPIPPEVRAEADALRDGDLAAMAAALDARTAARIDLRNPARVQRAWEVLRATGHGLAHWQDRTDAVPLLPLADAEALALHADVAWLDARIAGRLRGMIADGALAEVREEMRHGLDTRPATQAIGARELAAHLRGETTLDEAISAATLATRRYAKRQRTWLRSRMKDWQPVLLS